MTNKTTYSDSGVDIEAAELFVKETVVPSAETTFKKAPIVPLTSIGSFASYVDLKLKQYQDPVIAVTTDGVGTKVQIARMARRYRGIGIDLVAMNVNDLIVGGATPVLFLDYVAMSTFDRKALDELIEGIAEGCKIAGCALVGGETAHMPGHYAQGDFDLAGFAVGIAERSEVRENNIGKNAIQAGDLILGIASTGIHSNGYSLVRRLFFEERNLDLSKPLNVNKPELMAPLADLLLEPTAIYVDEAKALRRECRVKGMAHITGGGMTGNLPRIYSDNVVARIDLKTWPLSPLFQLLQEWSHLSSEEMLATFNCGLGMMVIVSAHEAERAISVIKSLGRPAFIVGEIISRDKETDPILYI